MNLTRFFQDIMTPNPLPRHLPVSLLLVSLALAAPVRGQENAASPTPSAVEAPSPIDDEDRDSAVASGALAREIERATLEALRHAEQTRRKIEGNRAAIEREALRTAEKRARATGADQAMALALSAVSAGGLDRALSEAGAENEAAMREALETLEGAQTQTEKELEAREREREKAQEARDRAREKAQEAREREREKRQEAREKQREEAERLDELYDEAMESIDSEEWTDALRPLSKLMSLNVKVDAALYWTSYAQCKLNQTAAGLASLARLQKEFPGSRWAREGRALEMEVRGKSGQAPRPDQEDDVDLKLMAVSALAQTDPQEAMPLLTRLLASPSSSRKIKERSLFVLAQIGSDQAASAIAEVARGNSSPDLQRKAIQYLGVFGGPGNRKVLSEIYGTTTDNALRKQILNSFMVSGDKARVLNAAKTEKDPELRSAAVRLLGVMGGSAELSQMYATAVSSEEKKDILQALFIGGAIEPVAAAARGEKDKDVRLAAVRNLGLMGRKSQEVLAELYRAETDPEVKKSILNAFFLQGNATRLVDIARAEKDPELKKEAVHWLSLMNSKEARAYMLELLKD